METLECFGRSFLVLVEVDCVPYLELPITASGRVRAMLTSNSFDVV